MEVYKIWFDGNYIFIENEEGRKGSLCLEQYPKLLNASTSQRVNYEISPFGIHWEELDEDLSFEGFFDFAEDTELKEAK